MKASQRPVPVEPVEVTPEELESALKLLREEQAIETHPTGCGVRKYDLGANGALPTPDEFTHPKR